MPGQAAMAATAAPEKYVMPAARMVL